jgi:tryptophan-rich sensory protein
MRVVLRMWTFVFCEVRGLPVAECDIIDLAIVMLVVVVFCDPL